MPRHDSERTKDDRRRDTKKFLTPTEFQIAEAGRNAIQAVLDLDQQVFADEAWSLQQWESEFSAPGVIIILAYGSDRPCGFLSAGKAGDDLEIRKIGLLPAYRRHGLGKQLLHHAINHKASALRRCLIEVSSANAAGLAFYEKLGFSEIGRRHNYYADGSTAILMEKILSAPQANPYIT
ncbi:MAG: hypothetical protein OHK0011_19190 [Turneriella sp.]